MLRPRNILGFFNGMVLGVIREVVGVKDEAPGFIGAVLRLLGAIVWVHFVVLIHTQPRVTGGWQHNGTGFCHPGAWVTAGWQHNRAGFYHPAGWQHMGGSTYNPCYIARQRCQILQCSRQFFSLSR